MVKLIASDLDGTLLQEGQREVSKEAFCYIESLIKKEVLFVAASGRTYTNLLRLFAPVSKDIVYICENGALIKYMDETLFKAYFEPNLAKDIINDILSIDECEVLISGEYTSYLIPKEESYVDHMKNFVKNDVTIINRFEDIKEEVLKVSVYKKSGIDDVCDYFDKKWAMNAQCTVSGKCWQDFVPMGIDKGYALKIIQDRFNVTKNLTMCFGDNYNDLAMFDRAYFSYAMINANSEIRSKARYETMSVESILRDVVKSIN